MPNPTPAEVPVPTKREDIIDLLLRAEKGDEAVLPALRELVKNPKIMNVCGGELAVQAERSLIDKAGGTNLAFKEALARKLELLRAEVAGPNPTPLERLLTERVSACWLQLYHYETLLAQQEGTLSMVQGYYYQRRIDHAHRRYLASLKTLATVRKLALPVLQVNIGKKQVNIAAPVAVDAQAVEARRGAGTDGAEP